MARQENPVLDTWIDKTELWKICGRDPKKDDLFECCVETYCIGITRYVLALK